MDLDDALTFIERDEDVVYLRTQLLPVSMRLFNSSLGYKKIILECCKYLKDMMTAKYTNSNLIGISGANLAIPFNIIGVIHDYNSDKRGVEILINPTIRVYSSGKRVIYESCGSIRRLQPFKISRAKHIVVHYYNESGKPIIKKFEGVSVPVIQHEIDHNNGILISDKEEKEKEVKWQ